MTARTLQITPRFMGRIRDGTKRSTIRSGRREFAPGDSLTFWDEDGGGLTVVVSQVIYKNVADLTAGEAVIDGFGSLDELLGELVRIYPNLFPDSPVTVIGFTTN